MTRHGTPAERRSIPHRATRLALIMLAMTPLVAAAETVRFSFDPPTPLTYRETVRTTRQDEGAGSARSEKTVVSRNVIELVRKGEGYQMTVRPEPPKELRGGREVSLKSNPIMKVIENAVFVYTLDREGRLQSVEGYEAVADRIEQVTTALMEQVPEQQRGRFAQMVQAMMKLVQPESLLNRMRAEWDGRVADFAGTELEVGEALTGESTFPLPDGGKVQYLNAVRVEELVPCGDQRCARVVYQYDTDPSALEDFIGGQFEGLGVEGPSRTRISGGGERVIEPGTLLIHSETQRRKIVMEMRGRNGEAVTVTRNETRQYTYDYGMGKESAEPDGGAEAGE